MSIIDPEEETAPLYLQQEECYYFTTQKEEEFLLAWQQPSQPKAVTLSQ